MTDNEIIKALECCVSEQYTCSQCPYQEIKHYDYDNGFEIMPNGKQYDEWSCERWLNVDLLDLINRQKADYNRLEYEYVEILRTYKEMIAEAKAEAVKEFAERLKEYAFRDSDGFYTVMTNQIDNLLKERVGENDASRVN